MRIGCGAWRSCKCRGNGLAGASQPAGRGPWRQPACSQVWAYDFVFDACANGQQLKCLTVIDEFTREALAIDVAGSIRTRPGDRGSGQARSACMAPRSICAPTTARSLCRDAILRWLVDEKIETALIDPGKPWQNGIERILQRQVSR